MKLLQKKVTLFEKEISVVLIAFVAFGVLASAALLPYIGNKITAMVSVEAPMELSISENGVDWETEPLALPGTLGGGNFSFSVKSLYKGEVGNHIAMNIVTKISNDLNDSRCEDFESLTIISPTEIDLGGGNILSANTSIDLISEGLCVDGVGDDEGIAQITIPAKFGYNEDDLEQEYSATGVFKLNVAPATYTIEIFAEPQ